MADTPEQDTITEDVTKYHGKRTTEFVRHPGKTREDRMPVDERPRVQAAAERYRKLRKSQGLDA